jgi:hypothetical protein
MCRTTYRLTLIWVVPLLILSAPLPAYGLITDQSSGQSKCTLTSAESPAIRGIKLGMNVEQVLTTFPGSSEKPEIKRALAEAGGTPHYGVARLNFQPFSYPSSVREKFAGIDSYSVTLFDNHVTEIRVRYNGQGSYPRGPFWVNVDDFVTKLSEAFNLPPVKDWVQKNSDERDMKCADFTIEASTSGGAGAVALHDRTYIEKVKKRAAAEAERLRREFKP